MSILPSRIVTGQSGLIPKDFHKLPIPAKPQAMPYTPGLIYRNWNVACGGINNQLGMLPADFTICVIGGGLSGVTTALEFAKSGAKVTLLEASNRIGGRLFSFKFSDGVNIGEMGAMRFPPSEALGYYYAESLGYCFIPNFPDPGVELTHLSYQGRHFFWYPGDPIPEAFATVHQGWSSFIENGLYRDGKQVLLSITKIQGWLQSPTQEFAKEATAAWDAYRREFWDVSFYGAVKAIFGGNHRYDVPGGTVWTDDDLEKFKRLGVGSGGFGPFFEGSALIILSWILAGFETQQASFAKLTPKGPAPAGIQELAEAIWKKAKKAGVHTRFNTFGRVTNSEAGRDGRLNVTVEETEKGTVTRNVKVYNLVVVATSTQIMQSRMGLTGHPIPGSRLLSYPTGRAVAANHLASSSKLAIRVRKFWENAQEPVPRILIGESLSPQVYLLDYGDPNFGVAMVNYTWERDSAAVEPFTDATEYLVAAKASLERELAGSEIPFFIDLLVPAAEGDIICQHWKQDSTMLGAFAHARPGQENGVLKMFYDFEKLADPDNTDGILLVGDSVAPHQGGWINGALTTAMNIVSATFKAYGELYNGELAPVNRVSSKTYPSV